MTDYIFVISAGILLIGLFFMGLARISFRWRAFTNKAAWNGATLPFVAIGLIFILIGSIMVFVVYPR